LLFPGCHCKAKAPSIYPGAPAPGPRCPPWSQGCSAHPPIAAGGWYKHLKGGLPVLGVRPVQGLKTYQGGHAARRAPQPQPQSQPQRLVAMIVGGGGGVARAWHVVALRLRRTSLGAQRQWIAFELPSDLPYTKSGTAALASTHPNRPTARTRDLASRH
jgi:hypothetical protein